MRLLCEEINQGVKMKIDYSVKLAMVVNKLSTREVIVAIFIMLVNNLDMDERETLLKALNNQADKK